MRSISVIVENSPHESSIKGTQQTSGGRGFGCQNTMCGGKNNSALTGRETLRSYRKLREGHYQEDQ